ncbi:MAG: inorganic diphosphatase [Clostridia bacterium]|nr:inorganic diphosphatase [Clostridia bacterium]MBQ9786253.1 inorganic diphosphatase [Clostridia bacterium]
MNIWHDIERERVSVDEFVAFIEISKGEKCKYELDKETGLLIFDRLLSTSMVYPANYGFIPKTLGGDGDPLDVLVLASEPLMSGCLVECRPIGMIVMIDDGERDEKIIAVAKKDPFYAKVKTLDDLPKHTFDEMSHFFKRYKELQNKVTEIKGVEGIESAQVIIEESINNYKAEYDS